MAWASCRKARTVKTIVCQCQPASMATAWTASVTPPISRPTQTACCQRPAPMIDASGGRGGRCHGVPVGGLDAQRERRRTVSDEVDPEDLDGDERAAAGPGPGPGA